MTIIQERFAELGSLEGGAHPDGNGMCVMEAVAYITGEPWSDHPECVSPVIGAFMRNWNDSLRTDEERDRLLKPLIPVIVGTNTGAADDETRAWMATDWLVREQTPAWLRLAGLSEHADALENLAALTGREQALVAQPALDAAASAAWAAWAASAASAASAAWAASAASAAWDASAACAAWAASAASAAWDASAASAAWAACGASAAWAASGASAASAAWDASAASAACAVLEPTVTLLQPSAVLLVRRMCEVGR